MSTHKNIDKICVAVLVISLLITVLFMNGASFGLEKIVDEDAETYTETVYFTKNDRIANWDTEGATEIVLEGTDGSISGSGAYFYDGDLVIASAGSYVISGELTDGSIVVDAHDNSKVWILLNGVSVTCSDDACIQVDQADKVFLTLAEGSENVLESGSEYSDEALSDGTDGAIFSHDDLTINGSGILTVTAGYKHGIACNDDLVIAGGSITVTAVKDAIRANDSLCIADAQIRVDAGDDGIVTAKDDSFLYVESGTIEITAADDGIHTAGNITILDGDITIDVADDGIHSDTRFDISGGTITISRCYEGIEAPQINMEDGNITIYPTDDGLNANGGSSEWGMFGGMNFGGWTGAAFGSENADSTEVDDASEVETEAAEEVQAPFAGDDRSEAAGTGSAEPANGEVQASFAGDDQSEAAGASSATTDSEESPCIRISGGTLTIINTSGMDADGIDSNGNIVITGGTILISLTSTGGNNAIDYGSENGGTCRIDGGTVIACGSSSMVEEISSDSAQCSILYILQDVAEAGTVLSLKDEEGNVLLEEELPCSFSSAIISCSDLLLNETYEISVGETSETILLEEMAASAGSSSKGFSMGGMMGGHRDQNEGQGSQGWGNQNQENQQLPEEMSEGEMPQLPEGMSEGEMPQRPDGMFDGGMPQLPEGMSEGAMPQLPEGMSEGEMLQLPEGMSEGGMPQMQQNPPENNNLRESEEEETEVYSSQVALSELDPDTWKMAGVSVFVLGLGILVAANYRRRR